MSTGKKKIEIKKIEKESSRMTTFSKRRKGLFKKADEFRSKIGSKVAILVIAASGKAYPFGDIDAVDATLNCNLSLEKSSSIHPQKEDDSVRSNVGLKQWLNEVNLDNYDDIEELLLLKK